MANSDPYFDVCIFCAMAEEAEAVIEVFSRQRRVRFEQAFSSRTNREYRRTTILNNKGEPLSIHVSWPLKYGPVETSLHLKPVLDEYRPRFAAMTGICAGDKRRVKLGDLIVAERAFTYDSGKFVLDEQGRQVHRHDADPRHPDPDILQYARMFTKWKRAIARLPRPFSKRKQREWLLNKLLDTVMPQVDNIPLAELTEHAPDWRQIVQELQNGPDPFLTKDRALRDKSKVLELRFGSDEFPFQDPPRANCYIAPMASGSAVRSDDPFREVQVPVRGTIAVDMEGAAFYRTVADFLGIRSLLVKGVSDYADLDKDDSYHKYAAEASATYVLCFIKEYVAADRMPRMHSVEQLPEAVVLESDEARKTRTSISGMVKDGVQPDKALQPALLRKPFMAGDLLPGLVTRSIVHEQVVTAIGDRPADTQHPHIIALIGAGGFGKTTLARQVCHDEQVRIMFPDGVLWITLGQEPSSPINHIHDLVQALSGQEPTFTGLDAAVAHLIDLVAERDILLVIDDVWNAADLAPFTQGSKQLVRLVTTRDSAVLPRHAQRIDVPTMRDDEAMQMLQVDLPAGDPALLMRLIHPYGNWPLGVSLMHGVIYNRVRLQGQPLPDALAFIQQMIETRGLRAFDAYNARARHQAIRITMDLSLDLLSAVDRSCFMSLAIFPAEIDIPLATVAHWWHTYAGYDPILTEVITERLAQMSLLERFDPVRRSVRIHQIIHKYLEHQQRTELASLHAQFLDGYAVQSWANLAPEESYLWWALRYHLIRAQRISTFLETVLDLRYLITKTHYLSAAYVDYDFQSAAVYQPTNSTLMVLHHAFGNAAHLLDACETWEDIALTFYSRLIHIEGLQTLMSGFEQWLPYPRITPKLPLPDLPPQRLLRTLVGHVEGLRGCALSEDSLTLVTASADATLKVWDTRNGTERISLEGHEGAVYACALNLAGDLAISAGDDGTVRVWDLNSGAARWTLSGHTDAVSGCAVTTDGTEAVSAGQDGTLRLWDLRRGEQRAVLYQHDQWLTGCAISADGSVVAAVSIDGYLLLWTDRSQIAPVRCQLDANLVSCAMSDDGSTIVCGDQQGILHAWDVLPVPSERFQMHHQKAVYGCAVSSDGSVIISASLDRSVRVWDGRRGELRATLAAHTDNAMACTLSSDASLVVSGSEDGTARVWTITDIQHDSYPNIGTLSFEDCAVSRYSGSLVCASKEGKLAIWNASGIPIWFTSVEADYIARCAINADGTIIASIGSVFTLHIWDAAQQCLLQTFDAQHAPPTDCVISADGKIIVSSSWNNIVSVWDVEKGIERFVLQGFTNHVFCCAVSSDSSIIAAGGREGTLKVWDGVTGMEKFSISAHSEPINACAISPDGIHVISASWDCTLKIWNIMDSTLVYVLEGHQRTISGCAWSPNGSLIVSTDLDGIIKVWEVHHGQCLSTLYVDGPLHACDWFPDSINIVAVGEHGIYWLRFLDEPLH